MVTVSRLIVPNVDVAPGEIARPPPLFLALLPLLPPVCPMVLLVSTVRPAVAWALLPVHVV